MEKKDLNNEHTVGRVPPSKSRSKRRPAGRAHHYRNRLNDAATGLPQRKRPNAQKHGIFAVNPTIPGEDVREFIELYSALIDEWQPSGPTEADAENDGGGGVRLQKRRRRARPPRKNSPRQWTGYSSSLVGFRPRAAVHLVRLPLHFPRAL